MPYRPNELEPRWQQYWDREGTFVAREDRTRPKFYALDMFPYPSAKGLHVGHPAGYTASDVVSRFKRARGFNVLHPMGFDAFGLPAEQAAIQFGIPPQALTAESTETFRRQLKSLGFSYDWSREVSTADPAYYKWTQYIFTLLHERGLAYEADAFVNWCPALGTVLANDEVVDGKSERGGHPVERKKMRQWMLRETAFAEAFLQGLDALDWPEATKKRQREFIGRSEGAHVDFAVAGREGESVTVFTTRPDTLWGVTYMVLAPEHPLVDKLATAGQRAAVEAYRKSVGGRSDVDRQQAKAKTGVDTGARARNPVNGEEVPVWIADYVLMGYGTGAIMAVPAHDERDWEFAKAMGLPIREVISGGKDVQREVYPGEGSMVNSAAFDGTPTKDGEAIRKVVAWLEEKKLGRGAVTYKLRDWTFARQRYWGEPIPVLKKDGEVVRALGPDELPLVLPPVKDYRPTGTGESPLSTATDWVEVRDPKTGQTLRREVDTMPGSAGSSWYFLRYCDPRNAEAFCARDKSDYWMPVDLYVGGPEHTTGHLLYSRMWQRFLHQQGLVRDPEPFQKLRHQGMILGATVFAAKERVPPDQVEWRDEKPFRKDAGEALTVRWDKMSKRHGNVVNPDDVVRSHGADALRVYICFMGPLDADKPWQTNGLEGQSNWLRRAWRLFFEEGPPDGDGVDKPRVTDAAPTEDELRVLHKAVKKVTRDIESLDLNTAISALHVATRELLAAGTRARAVLEPLAQLVAPFAPHFAEEVWLRALGREGGISYAPWPAYDDRYAVDQTVTIGVQVLGKTRGEVSLPLDADEATALAAAHADARIAPHLAGKRVTKVIYKPNRILNLIVQ